MIEEKSPRREAILNNVFPEVVEEAVIKHADRTSEYSAAVLERAPRSSQPPSPIRRLGRVNRTITRLQHLGRAGNRFNNIRARSESNGQIGNRPCIHRRSKIFIAQTVIQAHVVAYMKTI